MPLHIHFLDTFLELMIEIPNGSFFSFQFQFVNSFLSLFYIAFYLQDMDRLQDVSKHFPH